MGAVKRAPVGAFIGGVLLSQIVNNALHLAQPLLMLELSGSLGKAAFFSAFDTAVHMGGTIMGGWPADRFGAKQLLVWSTFLRGAALGLIPAAWALGHLTFHFAMAAYTLDAFARGFVDTAAHTVPLALAGGDRAELDRINSRYEFAFDLGAVAGPMLLGLMMLNSKGIAAHLSIPLGFVFAALVFSRLPSSRAEDLGAGNLKRGGALAGLRLMKKSPRLLFSCLGLALLNLYPLRKLMSAFFAKAILSKPAAAGWVGAAFGLGGALGALVYGSRAGRSPGAGWVAAGACGVLALAIGWIPGNLAPMMAATFVFALTNVGARLALTRRLQEDTPMSAAGGVTAVARFASNGVSVLLKALLGAAFAFGAGARGGFLVIGASLAAVALAQLGLAAKLGRRD